MVFFKIGLRLGFHILDFLLFELDFFKELLYFGLMLFNFFECLFCSLSL